MFEGFFEWIEYAWMQLKTVLTELVLTIQTTASDALIYLFIILMDAMLVILSLIFGAFNVVNYLDYLNLMPDQILNVLNLLGIGQGISMLFSAYLLKFTFQLIPMVGLGRK